MAQVTAVAVTIGARVCDSGVVQMIADTPQIDALRPSLRGSLHRWSAPIAVLLTAWLAAGPQSGGSRAAVIVYGACVVVMLTASGVYHMARWSPPVKHTLRRVDHAAILLAIGGTYTGVIATSMSGPTRTGMLVLTWAVAAIGVGLRVFWFHAPGFVLALVYIGFGWMLMVRPGAFLDALTVGELAWLAAGGLAYTAGAVFFAAKRPNPWPRTFGYHEVWHTFVVTAAFCHFVAIALIVRR